MKLLSFIFVLFCFKVIAQDKLILKSGQVLHGEFHSFGNQSVLFKCKDSLLTSTINSNKILIVERSDGERHIIGQVSKAENAMQIDSSQVQAAKHAFGIQPFGVFLGRITLVYEHFFKSGKLGLSIPFSLTFDPFGVIYNSGSDSTVDAPEHIPGVAYITGMDLNYYFKESEGMRFYMGPRIRYGTDKMLRGLEGINAQYQFGWHIQSGRNLSQHLSIGYGFVKILNIPSSSTLNPDQLYGWVSFNYRISLLR